MGRVLVPEPMLNSRQVADILGIKVEILRQREKNGCAPRSIVKHELRKYPHCEVQKYLLEMARENGWEITDNRLCLAEAKLNRMCGK